MFVEELKELRDLEFPGNETSKTLNFIAIPAELLLIFWIDITVMKTKHPIIHFQKSNCRLYLSHPAMEYLKYQCERLLSSTDKVATCFSLSQSRYRHKHKNSHLKTYG